MPRRNNADKACTTGERHSKRERSQAEQHNIGWQDSGLRNWAVEKKARYDAERYARSEEAKSKPRPPATTGVSRSGTGTSVPGAQRNGGFCHRAAR